MTMNTACRHVVCEKVRHDLQLLELRPAINQGSLFLLQQGSVRQVDLACFDLLSQREFSDMNFCVT